MIHRSIVDWSQLLVADARPECHLCADSLSAGLEAIARESPAIVLTDLILPDGEGLELVERVRAQHPHTHVILMTAYGNEEVAMRALRAGAANYIAKKNIANDLVPLVRKSWRWPPGATNGSGFSSCLVRHESVFVLDNDPDLIAAFMKLVREELAGMEFWDETGLVQVSIALQEARHQCGVSRQSRGRFRASPDG